MLLWQPGACQCRAFENRVTLRVAGSLVSPAEVAWHLLPARPVLHPGRRACNSARENLDIKMRTHRRDLLNGWQVKQSSASIFYWLRDESDGPAIPSHNLVLVVSSLGRVFFNKNVSKLFVSKSFFETS